MANLLVTRVAGFVGFHLCQRLLDRRDTIIGIRSNLNNYYDVSLKQARLEQLKNRSGFSFKKLDLADREGINQLFAQGEHETKLPILLKIGSDIL